MERAHISYFDMIRGVAIIFVIICHSYSGNPLDCSAKESIYLLLRQIVTCAVPLFLAESGYFLATKSMKNGKDYWQFFKSHSLRVWIPMVIWSIPLFLINKHENYIFTILYLMSGGYSIYYFITLIIQYYAMQPIFVKINRGRLSENLI